MSSKLMLHRAKDATEGSAERTDIILGTANYEHHKVHDRANPRHIITQC